MKRFVCLVLAALICAGSAFAEEGMWLLPLLQKNTKALKSAGCRLSPEEIYSVNHSSLKDAVVQFGGGCTAEIVSDNGLLLTNHHCGYGSIQKLSSVEHDYLADGYWAMNRSEELPVDGLTVTFLQYMNDVTPALDKAEAKVRKEHKSASDLVERLAKAREDMCSSLVKDAKKENPDCEAYVQSFFNDNIYYLIVTKTYRDIRFVGAPPSSIGKFGADTDNWMWPRHTCDFSMFRVYAGKNNEPKEYSSDNVPYSPKGHLKISLSGVREGDFTMIMGYPGRTTRFQTSEELLEQIELNDIRIAARTVRQDILMDDMLADPAVKIQYASKYSSSSNGWKKWQGMKLAFNKLGIIDRAKKEEAEFVAWCKVDPQNRGRYLSSPDLLKKGVQTEKESYKAYTLLNESLYRIELVTFANSVRSAANKAIKEGKDSTTALKIGAAALTPKFKDYSLSTDFKVAKAMLKFYCDNASPENGLDLNGFSQSSIDAYVEDLFANSVFTGEEELADAINSLDAKVIFNDPALKLLDAMISIASRQMDSIRDGENILSEGRKLYTAGLLDWKKGETNYPDANFTMRLTYGNVKPYSPRDAVIYKYYTTLNGVMEKEDPDNWEFVVPEKLKELFKSRDFGQYAMADGQMPACFLSNNDITGGNSGSPVMNAKGELVGLAFDGNWESMSSDVMFEPDLQRCINVDIRYVLFIMDKFGGAGYLLNEMDIVR